jgi:hypothetical protein
VRQVFFVLLFAGILLAESAAGLKWTAPSGWVSQGAAPMRAVTYTVPEKAECIVYFFGSGQGGSVEANLERWKGQFSQPGKTATRKINGISVTTLDIGGTYTATGGQVKAGQSPQPGYRMLATVAEGPGGNIFIRLIGPEKAVAAAQPAYEKLLLSLQRQ